MRTWLFLRCLIEARTDEVLEASVIHTKDKDTYIVCVYELAFRAQVRALQRAQTLNACTRGV
jgi:hypothetical protein